MLYSIAKKLGLRREIQKIKKMRKEASKETYSSSEDWYSCSLLASNSSLDKDRRHTVRKEINKLDHAVKNNIKDYNDQYDHAIDNEPTLDNSSFNLSIFTRDPLPVVTVSLRGGKKHRANLAASITCLWDSGATKSMIKRRHTKHYERKMRSNRVTYSIAAGVY